MSLSFSSARKRIAFLSYMAYCSNCATISLSPTSSLCSLFLARHVAWFRAFLRSISMMASILYWLLSSLNSLMFSSSLSASDSSGVMNQLLFCFSLYWSFGRLSANFELTVISSDWSDLQSVCSFLNLFFDTLVIALLFDLSSPSTELAGVIVSLEALEYGACTVGLTGVSRSRIDSLGDWSLGQNVRSVPPLDSCFFN